MVTAGPAKGSEFPLGPGEMVVGRSAENAIAISDTSVSRKHCVIRKTDDGWSVSDLGSGNGTLVNGEPIEGDAVLSHGDSIALGDTVLEFRNATSGARAPVPRRGAEPVPGARSRAPLRPSRMHNALDGQQKKSRAKVWVVLAVVVAGGAGLAGKAWLDGKALEEAKAAERAKLFEAVRAAQARFQQAKELVKEGRWAEAAPLLAEVAVEGPKAVEPLGDDPSVRDTFVTVPEYVRRAEREVENQAKLDAAKTALGENNLAEARAQLDKVSKDTVMDERRRELLDQLLDKARGKAREASQMQARLSRPTKDDVAQILALATDVLAAESNNRDALGLKAWAEATGSSPAPRGGGDLGPRPGRTDSPSRSVAAMYALGDAPGALAAAASCAAKDKDCKALKDQIERIIDRKSKIDSMTATELESFVDADRRIASSITPLARPAAVKLANALFQSASSAKAAANWAKAVELAMKSLSFDPHNVGAQNIVSEGKGQVQFAFQACYQKRGENKEEALACFREFLRWCPKSSEYFEKTNRQIAFLTGDGPQ